MNIAYRVLPERNQEPLDALPFHCWKQPDHETSFCDFHRDRDGYRLRFPELADFAIAADGCQILAVPAPDIDAPTLEHLYLNQVLPLVRSHRGEMVFHASAVAIKGIAVAFFGESGRGKSTLATSFVLNDGELLSDDGLVLEWRNGCVVAAPGHASVRLWPDSREALVGERLDPAPPVAYSSKSRLLAGGAIALCREPARLGRCYFLGDGRTEDIVIAAMGVADAMLEWTRHSFLLDIQQKPRIASQFRQVAELVALGISYRLDYPRDFARLPEVRQAVINHLRIDSP